MIAIDTNVLVHASRDDMPAHDVAHACLLRLAEGRMRWTLPWQCVIEFLAVVTNPRVFDVPTPLALALEQVEAWLASPSVILISEPPGFWEALARLVAATRTTGPRIHDARIAALCTSSGVEEIWTADRDFSRFPGLRIRNPLVR